ncbi:MULTISPECIES: Sec-independent protein translocase family protein [Vibrio harveyi group]|uniref:DUF1845 domain-containing protein n=1 Tax=Vibrio parahaemolyticus TaxID=670 RepID=A0AAX1G178_VIBPH|nr:hypothetical protein [Vibrio parahaemolyticus]KFE94570.1 hypothetical protein HB39_14580 [Vibrio parahaemolyticus]MBX5338653.1 DUF1845 domain-containing protein [Vibrio parahaemolyticus]QHH13282.1 DUF1845 domain-containing protein [Vibrio parahaemolyticus]HBC3388361.1 DUF1845 domain-containing protein [Vibrio parahaemolyticus]HBC3831650.1 DUF1845 domain-containing protein [Vibrio parahaemolyticus]
MELQSKRLCALWDHNTYTLRSTPLKKPIDGLFLFNSLFSVEAFASRPEQNITTKLSKLTAEKLLKKVRALRNDINQQHRQLITEMGDITLNEPQEMTAQVVEVEQRCFTPGSIMLMKVFMVTDSYFTTLNRAKLNGELTEKEMQTHRTTVIKQITQCLFELNKTCLSFHKVRKQAEAAT